MDRPALYLGLALYAVAAAAIVVYVAKTARFTTGLLTGAVSLFAIERSIAVLGYFYPRAFGWTKNEVAVPDAPDIIPAALLALVVCVVLCVVGLAASLFVVGSRSSDGSRR